MKALEFEHALQKHGVAPLYVIAGEEDDLRDRAVALLKAATLGEESGGLGEFNFDVLYGDESDASEILARAKEVPAFAARRLVLVKAAEKLSTRDGEALIPYVKTPCETTTLVFVAAKLDGRTKLSGALKEKAVLVDCGPLPDPQLLSWIRVEAGRLGVRMNEGAALLLRDLGGSGSLALVKRELEKLAAYVPDGKTAGPAEVEAVRGSEVGASVFDLTVAIGARNRARVLRIVIRNLEVGEAPLRIFGSLVWQYRQLWKAKDSLDRGQSESEAARILRMPPFKVREFVGRFSEAHLKAAFKLFLETDSKLKGGSAGAPARVLETLLLELCARDGSPAKGTSGQEAPRKPQSTNTTREKTTRTIRSSGPSPR